MKNNNVYYSIIASIVVAVGCGVSNGQNLIQNGSFEDPVLNPFEDRRPVGSFNSWTVGHQFGGSAGVDIVSSTYYWPAVSGTQSLDLVSDFITTGNYLRQDITTTIGQTYRLGFWYANNKDVPTATAHYVVKDSVNTLLDTAITHAGSTAANMNWQFVQVDFTALATSTSIMFVHYSPSPANSAIVLDDVSVVVVPEPATAALGLAFLTVWGLNRRTGKAPQK